LRWSELESDLLATVWIQPHSRALRALRSEDRQARLIGPVENRVTAPLSLRSKRFPPHPATNAMTNSAAKNFIAPDLIYPSPRLMFLSSVATFCLFGTMPEMPPVFKSPFVKRRGSFTPT
jgi:hypothetical protein